MAIRVQTVEDLQQYFRGVVHRAQDHGPGINEIIYPLLGLIVLKLDENSEIQVKTYADAPANILWMFINGSRYAFRYEHADDTIEIRADNYRGSMLHKINNATGIAGLVRIFDSL